MKALTYQIPKSRSGKPEVRIIEIPIPTVTSGEVLVRVQFAGLNNFDLETSKGKRNRAISKALKKAVVVSGIERPLNVGIPAAEQRIIR